MPDPQNPPTPEPWLRGPVPGIAPELQPVAHCFLQVREDMERAASGLSLEDLRARPGNVASLSFHLRHIPGSIDRLFTYAAGRTLDESQKRALVAEKTESEEPPPAQIAHFTTAMDEALDRLRAWPTATLGDPRAVGKAGLPSTVRGLLFHAAEHAHRHTGAAVATAKIVRATPP